MTPDLTTEVIGYRQWYVTPDLELRAAHKRQAVWTPGVNTAQCHKSGTVLHRDEDLRPCAEAPGHDCECGMYALHSPDDFWYGGKSARLTYSSLAGHETGDVLLSGVVVAWGNIEVHHSGFRAQHARVVALAAPKGKRDAAVGRAVAGEYAVPMVSADELPRIASEFGSPVPEAMRPDEPAPGSDFARQFQKMAAHIYGSGYTRSPYYGGGPYTHSITPPATDPFTYTNAVYYVDPVPPKQKKPWRKAPKFEKPPLYDPRHFQSKRHGGLA